MFSYTCIYSNTIKEQVYLTDLKSNVGTSSVNDAISLSGIHKTEKLISTESKNISCS
jgi:putative ubiquitin-RnfH superfamily antitoxin RatB of RatAB toxin-antitoxin module